MGSGGRICRGHAIPRGPAGVSQGCSASRGLGSAATTGSVVRPSNLRLHDPCSAGVCGCSRQESSSPAHVSVTMLPMLARMQLLDGNRHLVGRDDSTVTSCDLNAEGDRRSDRYPPGNGGIDLIKSDRPRCEAGKIGHDLNPAKEYPDRVPQPDHVIQRRG